ncbi:bifunctional glutamate N-acetyltransferase/amino-acid acetyltransferase ArgJ [bacterium]|nr:bifunctional glutamate N-acetyltransferase/amino-acid acetyltransferase ArgJ [bacterium]MBU1633665.1 bifunctional glutamate N-acetyltransferase/amino-acid acetyltransferase ArgJ [bacterium]MBU1874068.1 bifunctional glutamate N-acetyltransferase/amino-acid acetyltransferase ArgJ [bacterium]
MKFIQNPKITDPKGYTAAAMRAGFKRKRKDLCIIKSNVPAKSSVKFTKNMVKAAPLQVAMESLKKSGNMLQALIINSGNANAGTGQQGLKDTHDTIQMLSDRINIPGDLILASSTGVIGELLDMEKMTAGIKALSQQLSKEGGSGCAEAILTTDTVEKSFGVQINIQGIEVTISGITKGSGMIQPNMATMLAFVTTDADIDHELLDEIFTECVEKTFNMITVDGHTSTNDTALIMANGLAGNPIIQPGTEDALLFHDVLMTLSLEMAKSIVKDGEGATKFVTIHIDKVDTFENAKKMAFGIANSALVKTAIFGQDPNWGRILSAAGMVDVVFDPDKADLRINGVYIYQNGSPVKLDKDTMKQLMLPVELDIILDVYTGEESALVYTSDLSYEYVKINAEYHT